MSEIHQPPSNEKSLSGLAWTWIACGIIAVILLGIGLGRTTVGPYLKNREKRSAAELVVQASADLGKVSSSDFTGKMEIGTNAGARYHVSYDDLLEGRFIYPDSRGNLTTLGSDFSTVPEWVPKITDPTAPPAVSHSKSGGKTKGSYSTNTPTPGPAIHLVLKNELEANGFLNSSDKRSTTFACGTVNLTIERRESTYSDNSRSREISVRIIESTGNPTHIQVTYEEK